MIQSLFLYGGGEGNAEERLDCLNEPTVGADILDWPVREDLVVDCGRELVLQVGSEKVEGLG
jgi:hypothetical protein